MPRYLVAANYTAEGDQGLLKVGGSARRASVTAMIEGLGGRVETFDYAFGADDVYVITELPEPPRIFPILQERASLDAKEMYSTFNMGTGFVVACAKGKSAELIKFLTKKGERAFRLGHVEKGKGETVVRGAGELRLKESDRIATVVEGLRGLGGELEATEDGFVVQGTGGLRGGALEAHGDHRLAMLGAVAGLASREGVEVIGMEAAAVSYPGFEADLAALRR